MPTITSNLALTLPTPDVDTGWGSTLNTDFTKIDDIFAAAGTGTSIGLNVGSGKTMTMGGTLILGRGDGTNTVTAPTIRGAARTGTNVTGANLTIDASNGTGTGGSGAILLRTAPAGGSGSGANSFNNSLVVANNGCVGFGTTSPTHAIDVVGTARIGDSGSAAFVLNLGRTGVGSYRSAYIYGDGTDMEMRNQQNGYMRFSTNNNEQMRIANTGALGFNGANYGSSGQVLTSNGTGSPPSWQSVPVEFSSENVAGQSNIQFTGIESSAEIIQIVLHKVKMANAVNDMFIRLNNEATGYESYSKIIDVSSTTGTTGFVIRVRSSTSEISGVVTIARIFGDTWDCSYTLTDPVDGRVIVGGGTKATSTTLTSVGLVRGGTVDFASGNVRVMYFR